MLSIEEIKEILVNAYDEWDRGCYINGRWFSIEAIIEILKKHC